MSDKKSLTRADLVRQRRKEKKPRRLIRPTETKRRPTAKAASSNVTLDAGTARTKPIRQYQVVAATATGQLNAPTLPRFRVGWRLLSFTLAMLFSTAIYFAWTLPMFRVNGTTLAGNQILNVEEISSALAINGAPVFLVIPEEAETVLRINFPEIASVDISVDLPNIVTATIVERQPVIRWEQGGAFAWVDAEGVAFRPRGDSVNLVTVSASGPPPTGPRSEDDTQAPTPFVAPNIIESIRLLAPYVPQGSVLLYDPKYGVGWADGRGWTVWFGSNAEQTDVKLRVYTVLIDSLAQHGITPIFINVAYPNAPYYRLGQ